MLSITRKFLFVHVPKTGGNSIQSVLAPYADDRIVALTPVQDGIERFELRSERYRTHKHSTLAEYRQEYGEELFGSLVRFCCVRNPWDRCVSYYFSPHRGAVAWEREAFRAFIPSVLPLFHYLALNADSTLHEAAGNAQRILRFESLQRDFDAVCEAIGLPGATLPQRNRSEHADYRRYYDEETRSLVANRFKDECALFGYEF